MSCPGIQNLGYEAFSAQLQQKIGRDRVPVSGSIELTPRCNLRCKHCYLPLSQRVNGGGEELSLQEIQQIFSEIAEAGCLWLLLTGGEPLLRPDFLDIYDDAKRKGFIITLFTNGTLMTEAIADHLAEWRPFSTQVTLYGATQQTYERVTGIPGSFARCMRGIELLLDRGLPLKLRTVLMTLNQHELDQMRQISDDFGVDFTYDPVITGAIDGGARPAEYRLTPGQIIALDQKDEARAEAWQARFIEIKEGKYASTRLFACKAGHTGFHIDAYGYAYTCLMVRNPAFNLRQNAFQTYWKEFIPPLLAQEQSPEARCVSCTLRAACMQCPGMGLTECNDPEAVVPHLCELAHLRRDAFDSQPN